MTFLSAALLGLALTAGPQTTDERAEAERLARTGSHAEALRRFQALAATNPDDVQARLWIARLHRLMGHEQRALDVYLSILATEAQNVDALVGAGRALIDLGRLREAADALNRAEALAADNVGVLAAQGDLHRRAGRSTLALAYYERALVLQPGNLESRAGAAELYAERAHRVTATYHWERFDTDVADTHGGIVEINGRVSDQLRLFGGGHHERKFSRDETRAGGGFEWMNRGSLWTRVGALVGSDNVILPEVDTTFDLAYSREQVQWLAGVRYLRFDGSTTWIVSPGFTVPAGRDVWLTLRYFGSQTNFSGSADDDTNHGVSARISGKLNPRFWVNAGYLRGFEGLGIITVERFVQFEANIISFGVRFDPVPMTSFLATYEHQWRDDDSRATGLFVSLVQRF
jgi:YaiO family outer membrane protein